MASLYTIDRFLFVMLKGYEKNERWTRRRVRDCLRKHKHTGRVRNAWRAPDGKAYDCRGPFAAVPYRPYDTRLRMPLLVHTQVSRGDMADT